MAVLDKIKTIWIFSLTKEDILCLISLGSVCLCCYTCYSLPAPFFTTEAKSRDVSTTVIGLLFGMFELVVFLVSPVLGKYLSKLGYKRVYLCGILLSGISTVLLGAVNYIPSNKAFIVCCFLVRLVEAVGAAACLTSAYSIATSVFRQHVQSVVGFMEMCNGVGLMVGPAIGSGLYQIGGFGLPFYTTGIALICCGLLSVYVTPTLSGAREDSNKISPCVLIKNSSVIITGLSVMVAASGIGFLEPTLAGRLIELKISKSLTGVFFILLPLVYAVSSPIVGLLCEKMDCGRISLKAALLLGFISYILIGPSPFLKVISSVTQLVVASVCFGLAMSGIIVPSLPFILRTVSSDEGMENNLELYGMVSGFVSASFSLGAFLGPVVGGVMVDQLGFPLATTCYSFVFILVFISDTIHMIVATIQTRAKHGEDIEITILDNNSIQSLET